jgi:hypothetical protein
LAEPTGFENDRSDHLVSSEGPREVHDLTLEEKWSSRPILKLIGPIIFFAVREVGEGGRPIFLAGGVTCQQIKIVQQEILMSGVIAPPNYACKTVRFNRKQKRGHISIYLPKYAQIEAHIMPISGL